MEGNALEWTYTVTVGEDGKVKAVVDASWKSVLSVVGFEAFRVTQILPKPKVIEWMLTEAWEKLEAKHWPLPLATTQPRSWITAPLFTPDAEKAKRWNLAVLIRRCAFAQFQHIASDWYDETPDLKDRNLSDIRNDFDFQMKKMIEEWLISETDCNYALLYFVRKLDPVKPFSMGIETNNTTFEAYSAMVSKIISWHNTTYLSNGFITKELNADELEEITMLQQYVLLCQTWLGQNRGGINISQSKLIEIYTAICNMLKPDRKVVIA